ncbi:MAG: hypothetical protein PVF63_06635, partial [Gammaproteobacteria bacterium]
GAKAHRLLTLDRDRFLLSLLQSLDRDPMSESVHHWISFNDSADYFADCAPPKQPANICATPKNLALKG